MKANKLQGANIKDNSIKKNKIEEESSKLVETASNFATSINNCSGNEKSNLSDNNMQECTESQTAMLTETGNTHGGFSEIDSLCNFRSTDYKNGITSKNEIITSSPLNHKTVSPFGSPTLQHLFKNSPIDKEEEKLDSSLVISTNLQTERRKRKISTSDCYEHYNLSKSQSYIAKDLNGFESVLVYDINPVIHQESLVSSDISFSSMINDSNITQDINDKLMDVDNDPPTDPLFIGDLNEEDDTNALAYTKSLPPERRRSTRLNIKQSKIYDNNTRNLPKKQTHEFDTKEKRLLKKLKNIEEQEEEVQLDTRKKLQTLCIELVHKVPPQHKIELTGAHAPTQEDKRLFQKYGPLRKGPYSPAEDKVIIENWQRFCKLHDWDSSNAKPFLNWRHNGRYYIENVQERQKFVQFLANGLSWRTLYSVYSRFKILYCNKITQVRYSSKEDKAILMYIQNKHLDKRENKYTELAKLLRRTRRSISKRYHHLKKINNETEEKSLVNIRWTLPLIKKFIKALLDVTLSNHTRELRYASIPKPVWQKMEKRLNIDGRTLKVFWQHQLHLQLFSTGPIYLNDIKIQLIEYMYGKGISNTRDIIWPNVTRYFVGATAVFLCKTFFYLVQECNIDNMDNFSDIVEYLYHTKLSEIQNSPTDKFLPRIVYENGKIDILDVEDSDNIIDAPDIAGNEIESDFDYDT